MASAKGLEWTFDTVAELYEKARPEYVDALYRRIFDYIAIDESSSVLEIGIGAGEATQPMLRTGCKLTAVEYGESFAALCRRKFSGYPRFSVIRGRFEETEFADRTFDLVYCASAFHWIPEQVGYAKVFSMLKTEGVFACFDNHPFEDKGRPELADEIQRLYARYMGSAGRPKEYDIEAARRKAAVALRYGFRDIACELFHRQRTLSAEEYVALLGTYSDHIALEAGLRSEFYRRIEDAIDSHGGEITIYDTIDLRIAIK